jgi:hypothetical protein
MDTRVLPSRIKGSWRWVNHGLSSSTEVQNMWSYTPTPPYACTAWRLVDHQKHLYLKHNKKPYCRMLNLIFPWSEKETQRGHGVMGDRPIAGSLYLVAVVTTTASLSFPLQYRPHEAPNHTLLPVECCDQYAATVQHFSTCTPTK